MDPGPLPDWVPSIAAPGDDVGTTGAAVDAAVGIAIESASRGHGPFGSVIVDADGVLVESGFNHVIAGLDSTAHAEIHAIRRAEQRLEMHDLGEPDRAPLTLYASCEPCVMCFGAIYWSGLSRVVAAASAEQAEALGFLEGPVTPQMWERARGEKDVTYERGVRGELDPARPFEVYETEDGEIY